MPPEFSPITGAQGFQQSNPGILSSAALLGSLQVFKEVGMMEPIRERSIKLTGALEKLLRQSKFFMDVAQVTERYSDPCVVATAFTIITPEDPSQRGAQLSLLFFPTGSGVMRKVFLALSDYGVIGDEREPDVIRLAPAPLYNTIEDCKKAACYIEEAMRSTGKA